MARKFLFPYLLLFLLFAVLSGVFFSLLRQAPHLTIANHVFNPVAASAALMTGVFFLFLVGLWILYSRLLSSALSLNYEDVLAGDFLTFLPLLFFSLTPLILRHYINAGDLQARLKLFALGVGLAVVYLKLIQIRGWERAKASPWQKWAGWFSGLTLRKKLVLLFFVALLFFNAGTALLTWGGLTTAGDEPHYLLITQSLLQDRDFDLANNYAQRDYERYMMFEGKLTSHVVPGKKPGSQYSFHSPGIAILLLPFYSLGTLFKGKGMIFIIRSGMSLFGALFALQVYLYARSEWQKEGLAVWLWFLTSFSIPVFFYSIHVYPEIVVALLSLTVFRVFRFSTALSWPKLLCSSLFLGSFIWFHALKYIPLFVPLLVYCLWSGIKKFRPRSKLIIFVAVPALIFVLYLIFQRALYGTYSLSAVSWAQPMTQESPLQFVKNLLFNIPFRYRAETLAGYFFDQRDGLLLYAPIYFFALLGAWEMFKRKRRDFLLLVALTAPYVLTSAFLTQRTGYAPQARPLVAVVWAMIILLGYFLGQNQKKMFSALFNFAAAASFLFVILLLKHPLNLYQETTRGIEERGGGLFYLLSNIRFRLPDFLPSFIKVEDWRWLPNFIWLGATGLFVVVYMMMKRRTFSRKFSYHLLLVLAGMLIFFVWIVLFPRKVLLNPVRTAFPSGERVTFYSLSRSSSLSGPGRFQLREDNRTYRFNFTAPRSLDKLRISFGSARGNYACEIKIFDVPYYRGETAGEIKNLDLFEPPRYRLGERDYYELTLDLGKGDEVQTELYPFVFQVDFSNQLN